MKGNLGFPEPQVLYETAESEGIAEEKETTNYNNTKISIFFHSRNKNEWVLAVTATQKDFSWLLFTVYTTEYGRKG